jgi:transposase-like protein
MARQANQFVRDEWRRRIERQGESGLSIAEFCRRENISSHGFYVWRRNLRRTTLGTLDSRGDAKSRRPRRSGAPAGARRTPRQIPRKAAADFLQLPITAAQPAPWIELALADGTILRLPQQNLTALITALRVLRGERLELPNGEARHA